MPRTAARSSRAVLGSGLAVALLLPLAGAASAQEAPSPTPTASYVPQPYDAPTDSPSAGPSPVASTPAGSPSGPAGPSGAPSPVGAPVLRVAASTALVRGAGPLTVAGRYYRAPDQPAVGVPLDVLGRTPGAAGWAVLGRATTDAAGLAVLRLVPRVTREYAVRTTTAPALTSSGVVVAVQPVLSAVLTPRVTQVGRAGLVTGTLAPAYAGAAVLVQRRGGAGWTTVRTVAPDFTGAFRAVLAADPLGRQAYRAYLPAVPAHRAAASALLERVVEGRDLQEGDAGPDVLSLQQRLQAQRMDVGPVDGSFGYDLRHAVTAFQKEQGLLRTGVYDAVTKVRLAAPRPVVLRYPARGRAVEVDLAKQVLYLSEGGRLVRVVDVSTGSDQLYQQEGVTYRAFTPVGRFAVTRRIDGLHTSPLGLLYRPAFFTAGWAVHGSPSVPVYPASHGCVRVTDPAMDRLFPLLTVGVPVAVYR